MAISSNFPTDNSYIVYWLSVVENSYSVPNNTSLVTVELWAKRTNSGYTSYGTGTTYITVNGTSYNFPITTSMTLTDTPRKMATVSTMTIPHNADGSKTLTVSGYMICSSWNATTHSYNQALTTIPRASTIVASNFTVGDTIPLAVTEATSGFTYNLSVYINGSSIASRVGIAKPTSITLDATETGNLLTSMAESNTSTVTVYIATFSGATQVGNTQNDTCIVTSTPSSISVFNDFTISGSSIPITIARTNSIFTHDLELKIGSTTIATRTGIATDGSITLTVGEQSILYYAMSTVSSAIVTLYCTQKIGSTVRGSIITKSVTATINASIIPTISSITATGVNATVGNYIKNITPITFTINGANGAAGSTIASYNINFNNINYAASSVNSGIPNFSGSKTATATVTDSRGRTATATVNITVLDYTTPTISAFSIQRASDASGTVNLMGTYARVNHTATISSLKNGATEKNLLTYKIYSKLRTTGTWTLIKSSTSALSLSGFSGFSGYPITSSYDFKIEITDLFNVIVLATGTMSTGQVTMSLGKTGIGVGKIWEQGALDVEGNATVNGTVTSTGFIGSVTGNAATATKLLTTRAITLIGDASGTVNFDGSAAVSIPVVIADDSHNHAFANITSKPTTIAGYGITNAVPNNADSTIVGKLTTTSGFGGIGRTPAYTYSTTVPNGSYVTITHNLGYYPMLSWSGTCGNITMSRQDTSVNALQVYVYSTGGAQFIGKIYMY